jgi:hypothetical protein
MTILVGGIPKLGEPHSNSEENRDEHPSYITN